MLDSRNCFSFSLKTLVYCARGAASSTKERFCNRARNILITSKGFQLWNSGSIEGKDFRLLETDAHHKSGERVNSPHISCRIIEGIYWKDSGFIGHLQTRAVESVVDIGMIPRSEAAKRNWLNGEAKAWKLISVLMQKLFVPIRLSKAWRHDSGFQSCQQTHDKSQFFSYYKIILRRLSNLKDLWSSIHQIIYLIIRDLDG